MSKQDLLRRVRTRMQAEGLTQRDLAAQLQTTQGHLSKVLRGQYERRSRVVRALEEFAAGAAGSASPPTEDEFLSAARELARRRPEAKPTLISLMHFLATRAKRPRRGSRAK